MSAASGVPEASAADPMPDAVAAEPADLAGSPEDRTVPRSDAGFLMEVERLAASLSDRDRDLVLDLARRLASGA